MEQPQKLTATSPSFGNYAIALSTTGPSAGIPRLEFPNSTVNPLGHVSPGTSLYFGLGVVVTIIALAVATVTTFGMVWVGLIASLIASYFFEKRYRMKLLGTSIKVTHEQFPELHEVVVKFSQRLGMSEVPDVFIVEDNVANGFAAKIGARHVMLLTDDEVWSALACPNPKALGWTIGHELAHMALGHTGLFRSILRGYMRPLSRLDELTCDNVALALVADRDAAVQAVSMMAVGPQLMRFLNREALERQAQQVVSSKLSRKVERPLTHPMVMRRLYNMMTRDLTA